MKTTITGISALSLLLAVALGCSWTNSSDNKPANTSRANANKSVTDTVIDTAVGEKTLGMPECDEVFRILTDYANNPEDNFAVRAGKAVVVNQIKDSLRTTIEENQADKAQLATACREAKAEFTKYQNGGSSNKAK